jgi:hypothetical protein
MTEDQPSDEEVVQTAATAAEEVIFARYSRSEIRDFDVTVHFADEQLEIDVYLDAEGEKSEAEQVVEDAMLAARNAVDNLLA